MTGLVGQVREWLKGRKTYTLAAVLFLATLSLVASGHLTPTSALTLLLVAACGFPATFRAALVRHRDEELRLLQEIVELGASARARNAEVARALALKSLQDALSLSQQLTVESELAPPQENPGP